MLLHLCYCASWSYRYEIIFYLMMWYGCFWTCRCYLAFSSSMNCQLSYFLLFCFLWRHLLKYLTFSWGWFSFFHSQCWTCWSHGCRRPPIFYLFLINSRIVLYCQNRFPICYLYFQESVHPWSKFSFDYSLLQSLLSSQLPVAHHPCHLLDYLVENILNSRGHHQDRYLGFQN